MLRSALDMSPLAALSLAVLSLALLLPAGTACAPEVPDEGCLTDSAGPPEELLYVSNSADGTVSVVDPRACESIATIDVDGAPGELNTLADGSLVTVVLRDPDDDDANGSIALIDTGSQAVVGTLPVGVSPTHTGVAPDGETLWVGNDSDASLSSIDLVAKQAKATVSVGNGHRKLIFDDAEPYRVYTSDIADASVSVVDSASEELIATVPVGTGPHGLYYAPHSKQIYNCSGEPNGIDVIATEGEAAHTVIEKIPTDERCGYLTVSEGRYLWASAGGPDPETQAGVVYVIDTDHNDIVATVPVGKKPDKIEFLPELGLVIVANVNDASVSVIDDESYQLVRTIEVGGGEFHRAIKISRDGRHAYVPNAKDGTVTIFDVDTGEVRGTVAVGGAPTGIIVSGPGGGLSYPH